MENQVQVQNATQQLIQFAIDKGADLDKLEKLLNIKQKYDEMEAKKAYHKAMAEFKANAPMIDKDKNVSYSAGGGKVSYNHASLANVTNTINKALSEHGLSASWNTKQNGVILVTCKITHELGHSEETTLSAPADKSGSKNDIQAIGSTISYLERYTLLALTGLATSDMDDDGKNSQAIEYISDKEINIILDNLTAKEISLDKFLKYMKLESLEQLPKSEYKKALEAIKNKPAKKESN